MAKNKGIKSSPSTSKIVEKGGCPFSLVVDKTSTELLGPPFRIFREIAISLGVIMSRHKNKY
jgi:hypothetical protein